MIKSIIFFSLFSLSVFARDVVTIYSECDFKPYSYCVGNEVRGISVDIFKSIFSKIDDYSLKIQGIDWKKAMEIMKEGKKSKIKMIGTISYKPKERPFVIAYTKPFLYQNKVIFCNRKVAKNKKVWPKDFYHLKIAKMRGFSRSKTLEDAVKKGLIQVIEGNSVENILALMNGKVDCYINDEVATKGEILKMKKEYRDNNMSTKKIDDIKEVMTLGKKPLHIGFSAAPFPEREDLIKKINLAIGVMRNSDELSEIIKKNLDVYLHPNRRRRVSISLYNLGEKLVSDKLEGYGVIPQIITSAFKERDIDVDYKFFNYNYAYLLAKWGKECASVPWFKSKKIKLYFDFSDYIKKTDIYMFYSKDQYPKGIQEDYTLYRIGGIKGYYYDRFFKNNRLLSYSSFDTPHDAVVALLNGKIDVIPAAKSLFKMYIRKNFYNSKDILACGKKPVSISKDYLIFSKRCENSQDMKEEFNAGLSTIKKNGVLKKILDEFNLNNDEFY